MSKPECMRCDKELKPDSVETVTWYCAECTEKYDVHWCEDCGDYHEAIEFL